MATELDALMSIGSQPFKLIVDEDVCHACRRCLASETCRGNAFVAYDPGEAPFIDMSRCWGCLTCVVQCPFGAIVRVDYSASAPVTS